MRIRCRTTLPLALSLSLAVACLPEASAQTSRRCFAETNLCIEGRIREFWEQNGGLPVFGLPITPQQEEQVEGRSLQAQVFERNRLELHPENARPYDVLLGRLGADGLSRRGRDWTQFSKSAPMPGCRFFAETGHNICEPFLSYWRGHGLEFDGRPGKSEAESLALFGLPLSDPQPETIEGKSYTAQWFERARFELHPENAPPYDILLGLLGADVETNACVSPTIRAGQGIWLAREDLAGLPTSGRAWEQLKAAADGDLGKPDIADQNSNHDVNTLAVALVYARTTSPAYRAKAADAIMSAIDTENGDRTLALGRNLVSYIVAADLIDLRGYDAAREGRLRAWLSDVRNEDLSGRTLISTHEDRPNNWGTHAGAARVAADIYLGDRADLERAATVFKGWLGDRGAYAKFSYDNDLSWQADPANPVGVNPAGATRDGHRVDGAIPDDMQRGGKFRWPPKHTGYPWGAMEGALVQALFLSRAGYDAWNWSDKALLRAAQFLDETDREAGGWWAEGDDKWIPWLINQAYGTNFRAARPDQPGKNLGWADWVYGCK
jgi:hypothetical protein